MTGTARDAPADEVAGTAGVTVGSAAERAADEALRRLGLALRARGYSFVTPTPETHRRVNARPQSARARSLTDIFGWSRPFEAGLLPAGFRRLMEEADILAREGPLLRSRVRFSTLGTLLLAHSCYPTVQEDAIFFGPDTYRFARFVTGALGARGAWDVACAVDVGCGTGAGGLVLARALPAPPKRLLLSDISAKALRFARVNAALNGVDGVTLRSDVLAAVDDAPDLVIANPPYLVDPAHRLYRDGGGALGFDLSLRILDESLRRLAPGGLLLLYTGSAIVDGEDRFRAAAELLLRGSAASRWRYEEIDPDVFGEELETPAYSGAERIAAVGLAVER